MSAQPDWTNSLGFRQLIEDGLAIIRNEPMGSQRRALVLNDLSDLIFKAKQGSDLVRNSVLSVTPAQRSAYESFTLLDRFLNQAESEHWNMILDQSEKALFELRKTTPQLTEQQRDSATALLTKILSGLNRQPWPGIPMEPEESWVGH